MTESFSRRRRRVRFRGLASAFEQRGIGAREQHLPSWYTYNMASPKLLSAFVCTSCRQRLLPRYTTARRNLTTTSALRAADNPPSSRPPSTANDGALASLGQLSSSISTKSRRRNPQPPNTGGLNNADILAADASSFISDNAAQSYNAIFDVKPHRMHVYATKHNTHITLVQPPRSAAQTASSSVSGTSASAADQKKMVDVLLSLSAGNIGFRKAGRGSYDAAYQLAAFTLKQVQEKGMMAGIQKLEVVLRGFGAGREAVTKALLGVEGREIRGKIVKVLDATRLKFGGPRSKKPRRLG